MTSRTLHRLALAILFGALIAATPQASADYAMWTPRIGASAGEGLR